MVKVPICVRFAMHTSFLLRGLRPGAIGSKRSTGFPDGFCDVLRKRFSQQTRKVTLYSHRKKKKTNKKKNYNGYRDLREGYHGHKEVQDAHSFT